jgi:hypothetical protein
MLERQSLCCEAIALQNFAANVKTAGREGKMLRAHARARCCIHCDCETFRSSTMRKTLCAALAAAAALLLTGPADQAAAMPISSHATISAAAKAPRVATAVRYWRRRHWAWPALDWSPRHYWYAPLEPYAHYYVWGPYWGHYCYNSGGYGACYM